MQGSNISGFNNDTVVLDPLFNKQFHFTPLPLNAHVQTGGIVGHPIDLLSSRAEKQTHSQPDLTLYSELTITIFCIMTGRKLIIKGLS